MHEFSWPKLMDSLPIREKGVILLHDQSCSRRPTRIRDVPALDYQPAVDFTIYLEFFEFLLKCVSSILSLIE